MRRLSSKYNTPRLASWYISLAIVTGFHQHTMELPSINFFEPFSRSQLDSRNLSWVGIENFPNNQPRPSLGAFFATPETVFGPGNGSYSLYSCTIDARWLYTHAFLDASSGQAIIYDANPNPNGDLINSVFGSGPAVAALPSIYISDS